MNEIEKKRAFMTRKELGEEEYQRILDMIGKAKRFAELLALIPGMKEQIDNNPEEVKKKYGLEGVDFEDLKLQFYNENKLDFEKNNTRMNNNCWKMLHNGGKMMLQVFNVPVASFFFDIADIVITYTRRREIRNVKKSENEFCYYRYCFGNSSNRNDNSLHSGKQ